MGLFSRKTADSAAPDTASATLLEAEKDVQNRYERDVWWVENRHKLKALGVIAIIVLEALLAVVGIWAFADYFLLDYVEEQRLVEGFFVGAGSIAEGVQGQTPQELQTERTSVVSSGDTFDVITYLTNPNPNWVARVSYRILYRGEQTSQQTVLLMQDTTVPLVVFGLERPRPTNADLEIDAIEWYRVSPHEIPDPLAWKQERVNFAIEDVQHNNDIEIGSQTFGRTTFMLHNKTGYGYFEVPVVVVLKRGGTTVGVNQTVISGLDPRERRMIQIDWFDRSPSASTVEIYPILNLYDEATYLDANADQAVDLRDALIQRR